MKKGQSGPLPISTGSSVGGNTMSKKESLTKYPWYAWALLGTGLLAVSTAGATFRTIEGVGPLLKASWRLQATTLVMVPGFLYQWYTSDEQTKLHWKSEESRSALALSGAFLCLHFAAWVWSLEHTSLTHSLLFVTAHPFVVVAWMALNKEHLQRLVLIGAGLGFIGAAIALQDTQGEGEVTLIGDLAAFAGAVFVVGYMVISRKLRTQGMPIFLYSFPVTAIGALLLTILAVLYEGALPFSTLDGIGSFGWFGVSLLAVIFLALVPGLMGHNSINASLRWLPTILISVTLLMEPFLGGLIGWFIGVEQMPDMWTWIGGPIMIIGTALVSISVGQQNNEIASAQVNPLTKILDGDESGEENE
jgi:drug/metabolite transporter (DMT)-like permease